MSVIFHSRVGALVSLSNGNRTAQRNHPAQEFNNGVVFSAEPLGENQLFEVTIDKKVNSWSGSIEVGVTACDPANLNFPTSATGFRENTWVMSGCSILKDGHATVEEYGHDLDQLDEGDKVGVLRTPNGALHFFVNGEDQGVAATGVPAKVYAIIDMYGKCCQVTIVENDNQQVVFSNDMTNEAILEASFVQSNDRLVFHEKCGSLVRLSNMRRTAERARPLDEFNNGVVMTNRPLKDEEMFEIRLDRLVDKWSGSIEVGITTHNPSLLDFPATMTNMRTSKNIGTIMMSGCSILTNGKGTRREYGQFNLDELSEGDRIALMRKSNGTLHYYINGYDQGIAATRTPPVVWGVVDLYGMAVKVTILDREDPNYEELSENANFVPRNHLLARSAREQDVAVDNNPEVQVERLTFHPHCGSHAAVINSQRTAHRPNALDDFNNGVVLTSRTLRPNELFELRLDRMVDKWAGSVEIGVTTHTPLELDYPSTMTNIRSGTWMMTGNGVMHNGTTVIDEYGTNLDRLKVGDRVGVIRKEDGTLHFFVNGLDQGVAASNVPAEVYGVIDLYGQAAQATILDHTDVAQSQELELPLDTGDTEDLRFHHMHGRNASISADGRTAIRPNARGEFNDAIVMSNRPLRDNELFEISIDKMVDRWSGSIEAGVTLILPEELDFPNTMTDIDYDTWMLSGSTVTHNGISIGPSGSAIMQDGSTIRNSYGLDLDTLQGGCTIGMMRQSDGTLHFYHNGVDQGIACSDLPSGLYAVIDLYGQCAQVTITSPALTRADPAPRPHTENQLTSIEVLEQYQLTSPLSAEMTHRFSQCCGQNVEIKNSGCTACRLRNFNHGLIFSADPLRSDELFEIKIDQLSTQWSGSLQIGLTTMAISDTTPMSLLPASAMEIKGKVTWIVTGLEVKKNGVTIKENYVPSLDRLEVNNRVGVKRCSDGTMHLYINGEDMGVAVTNIPKNVFAVVDMYGMVDSVTVTSCAFSDIFNSSRPPSIPSSETSDSIEEDHDQDTAEALQQEFHCNHGKNIQLSNQGLTATRHASYNQGIVLSCRPLQRNTLFRVRIDRLNPRWSSSLMIGVLGFSPEKYTLPVTALGIKKTSWLFHGDAVFHCGTKIKEQYGPNLDSLQEGHIVGLLVDDDGMLHLHVNGVDQGVAARDLPVDCYALLDLYGQCEAITLVTDDTELTPHVPDYREKADIEDGMKEKMCRAPELNAIKNCEYQNMCSRFKATLGLPESYFNPAFNRCYCETCHKVRGDEPYYRRGDPPKDYAVPFGWCKFSLRIPPKAEMLNVFEKWHLAYHGTHVTALRKILDTGDLMLADVGKESSLHMLRPQLQPSDEKNKPEEQQDVRPISLSPTVRYSGHQANAPKHEFKDPKTKKTHQVRATLQVCVKPGSYKIGTQSIGINEQIDPKFSNNEIEWATKERGATVLAALIVRVD